MLIFHSLILAFCLPCAASDRPLIAVPDPAAPLPAETAQQAAGRHARVGQARAGTIILLHKGDTEHATENTLASIQLALDLGCQAVELDFRRTCDGVIVLMHDERLEHRLDVFGGIEDFCYEELLLAGPRDAKGNSPIFAAVSAIPALNDVLRLLRDRAGLVQLDLKTPGLDETLLAELRRADMLDHVVGYNNDNAPAFRQAAVAGIPFIGTLLGNRADLRPATVESLMLRRGQVLFLDDPRAALTLLGRPVRKPVLRPVEPLGTISPWPPGPLESVLLGCHWRLASAEEQQHGQDARGTRAIPVRQAAARLAISCPRRFVELAAEIAQRPDAETRRALAWNLAMIAKHRPELIDAPCRRVLVELLDDPAMSVRAEAAIACGRAKLAAALPALLHTMIDPHAKDEGREPTHAVLLECRGRYAFALGLFGDRSPAVARALMNVFEHREAGPNRMWLGDDGAMAAWALGKLRIAEAVPLLRKALAWEPPTDWKESDDDGPPRWLVYWDLQVPRFVPRALVEIGGSEVAEALDAVLRLSVKEAARRSPELLAETADARARFPAEDRSTLLTRLLTADVPQLHGAAVAECLRQPGPAYRALLKDHAPWAVPWWDVQHEGARP
jgi:hypothetical protein